MLDSFHAERKLVGLTSNNENCSISGSWTGTKYEFSLVRGSAGFTSSEPGGIMTDAPYTVLAFTAEDGHRTLVMTETAGDYTAVLQPGRYCLSAYQVKTGELIPLDPRQLKCIDVLVGKDVRLDVMLGRVKNEKGSHSQTTQEHKRSNR